MSLDFKENDPAKVVGHRVCVSATAFPDGKRQAKGKREKAREREETKKEALAPSEMTIFRLPSFQRAALRARSEWRSSRDELGQAP